MKIQVSLYVALCLFNLLMTAVLMQLLVESDLLRVEVAKVLITALIAVWNFIIFKFWIFSKKYQPKINVQSLSR